MNKNKKNIYDAIIIGGGVVGCAIMRKLTLQGMKVLLLEKGGDILSGASRANSAILHTGFDAPPKSLELQLMQQGYKEYIEIYEKFNLPLLKAGAYVVAWTKEQQQSLQAIIEKAHKNGVMDVKQVSKEALLKAEPHLNSNALGAAHIPGEYIIDPWSSPLAYITQAVKHGAEYGFFTKVISGVFHEDYWMLHTNKGDFKGKIVINSAGLFGDEVEQIAAPADFTIKPRKGQFLVYDKSAASLVESIILPVPTKITKGVLLCRTIFGNLLLGPTAEEQESRYEASTDHEKLKELIEKGEAMTQKLSHHQITTSYAGLRPATEHTDYQIKAHPDKNWVCVAGIRSTGLTAALGIADYVFELVRENFSPDCKEVAAADIIWPQMPSLSDDSGKRDYQQEGSGEILCHCEYVTKREIEKVFSSSVPPQNIGGLKRRTRALMGRCNGFNCTHNIVKIAQKYIDCDFDGEKE